VAHQPRKRFGQHFLTEPEFIEKIVSAVAPAPGETIVEIGPGEAAITVPLSILASELHAIEFDRDLAASLRRQFVNQDNVTIHEADALTFDYSILGDGLRIVGNLPYNISTPLLFHLIGFSNRIVDAHFMLQKEVVDRMAAVPGTKNYGRLTIMLGCKMEVVPLFDVPPEAFSPPPKVMSTVVRMRPLPDGAVDVTDPALLEALVRLAFTKRRKTLRNALKGMAETTDMEAAGIDPGVRPEEIPLQKWIGLANHLATGK
jgi:16S rRNA (adenine1518-N6/adenine1519-N6)-dimethyltransferase